MSDTKTNILVCGALCGQWQAVFDKASTLHNSKAGPFHALVCVGPFFVPTKNRNHRDSEDESDDDEMHWSEDSYLSGEEDIPVPTYFYGHVPRDFIFPEKLYHMGTDSGVYDISEHIKLAFSGSQDISKDDISSLLNDADYKPIDILITSCWPKGFESNLKNRTKDIPKQLSDTLELPGAKAAAELAVTLAPRYHFSVGGDSYYSRPQYRNINKRTSITKNYKGATFTRFFGLANCKNATDQKWLYGMRLQPFSEIRNSPQPPNFTENPFISTQERNNQSPKRAASSSRSRSRSVSRSKSRSRSRSRSASRSRSRSPSRNHSSSATHKKRSRSPRSNSRSKPSDTNTSNNNNNNNNNAHNAYNNHYNNNMNHTADDRFQKNKPKYYNDNRMVDNRARNNFIQNPPYNNREYHQHDKSYRDFRDNRQPERYYPNNRNYRDERQHFDNYNAHPAMLNYKREDPRNMPYRNPEMPYALPTKRQKVAGPVFQLERNRGPIDARDHSDFHHNHNHHYGDPYHKEYEPNWDRFNANYRNPPRATEMQRTRGRSCNFCLNSNYVEKTLILDVGHRAFMSLAKGGLVQEHVLIIPNEHTTSVHELDSATIREIEKLKDALRAWAKTVKKEMVFFHPSVRTQRRAVHVHFQCIPLPENSKTKQTFLKIGREYGYKFEVLRNTSFSQLQDITLHQDYFHVELHNGERLLYIITEPERFSIKLGREVIATVLNKPEKQSLKSCILTPKEQDDNAIAFAAKFKPFSPFQKR